MGLVHTIFSVNRVHASRIDIVGIVSYYERYIQRNQIYILLLATKDIDGKRKCLEEAHKLEDV